MEALWGATIGYGITEHFGEMGKLLMMFSPLLQFRVLSSGVPFSDP
jgi:hypothetical protein